MRFIALVALMFIAPADAMVETDEGPVCFWSTPTQCQNLQTAITNNGHVLLPLYGVGDECHWVVRMNTTLTYDVLTDQCCSTGDSYVYNIPSSQETACSPFDISDVEQWKIDF